MKQYIGGFLELELFQGQGPSYHAGALALQNARACVSHIISQTHMQRVWLPYYTCNALLEPFEEEGVPYQFYTLTQELEIGLTGVPSQLAAGEYIVYINYFGLKNSYVRTLAVRYGNRLLVDNTQDFFSHGYNSGWAFNSARKSFGVPDGGYLYGPATELGISDSYPINRDYDAAYLVDRLRGAQQKAYAEFVAYEATLTSQPLRISEFSASLLSQVDYTGVMERRRANFQYYHAQLGALNTLPIDMALDALPPDTVPFCYPLLPTGGELLNRQALASQNVFVPTLWLDVLTRLPEGFTWERQLTQALLPLPVDHRYKREEIDFVIQVVKQLSAQ